MNLVKEKKEPVPVQPTASELARKESEEKEAERLASKNYLIEPEAADAQGAH